MAAEELIYNNGDNRSLPYAAINISPPPPPPPHCLVFHFKEWNHKSRQPILFLPTWQWGSLVTVLILLIFTAALFVLLMAI